MFKKILIGILLLGIALVVVISLQSPDFRISRSTEISALPAVVFSQVNDFRAWNGWIQIKLEFIKPFTAVNTCEFTFKPEGGKTEVTWVMYGKNNFMSKAVGLFMNMEKMVAPDFEKGLAQLKAVSEAKAK